jgi:adenine/guanine phosphoribosyltransferase-like PRPP-binding protein
LNHTRIPPIAHPEIIYRRRHDYLDLLRARQGLYEQTGNSPLAAFAARDEQGRQLVGFTYANFAVIEEDSYCLKFVSGKLKNKLRKFKGRRVLCGTQMGGIALSVALGIKTGWLTVKAEKKVIKTAVPGVSKERSEMVFKRHDLFPDDKVIIVEDICHNFSTTAKLIALIESYGAEVVAIVCFLNRSSKHAKFYVVPGTGKKIPVISLVQKAMPSYNQDAPEVANYVKAGNILWAPKEQWGLALSSMQIGLAIA